MDSNHDDMLFSMLQDCKTLPVFLDQIFGFLKRRTDFYYESTDSAVGLPQGLAEKIVKHSFYKWKQPESIINSENIPVSNEVVIEEDCVVEPMSNVSLTEEEPFTKSDSYNGAKYETYSWSQNITDTDIVIKLPENTTAKDLKVQILPASISVRLKDDTVLLEGELCHKCKYTDAIWSCDKKKLFIHLDKCKDVWWDCLVTTEPKLDISKIDCTRPYEDLPEEAQAKIEELQWNQERKRLGLPTSDDLSMHETLRKAWDAEGSPFSGPFDPSTVSFN